MRSNSRIIEFTDKLRAAGISYRVNWSTRRDGKPETEKRFADVHHVAFVGDGFSPAEALAIIIDYGPRNSFGLYLDSGSNSIDADVARIAKPREIASIPAGESLAASLVMLSRLIGTDHPKGRQEMRDIVARVERDTVDVLAALTDARTFLCDSYPLRLGDGLRYVALRKQMDAAIAKAEGTPDPDAALIASINAAKPGKVWCFIAGMHPHPRLNTFLLGVAVLGEAGWEPMAAQFADFNAAHDRADALNKRLPWSVETCIAIVADTMRRSEQKRQGGADPEMLEALKGLRWAIRGTSLESDGDYEEEIAAADSAIARAEGRANG